MGAALNPDQLDGFACVVCAAGSGTMVVGYGPRGQLFRCVSHGEDADEVPC